MPASIVWTGGKMAVQVFGLRDALTNDPIADATVTAKLVDPAAAFADVPGSSFNLPLVNDGLVGHYGGESPEVPDLAANKVYLCDIQAVKNNSIIFCDRIPVVYHAGEPSRGVAVWIVSGRMAVQVFELKRAISNVPVSDATLTAQLLDPADDFSAVPGSLFTLPIVDSSKAHYGGTRQPLALTLNKEYVCEVKGTKNGAVILWHRIPVVAGKGSGV